MNGGGLQRDFEILQEELVRQGHQVNGVQFNARHYPKMADVNIFLEVLVPELFGHANHQWMIPNPEWWFPNHYQYVPHLSRILCKTQEALTAFHLFYPTAEFLGFRSRDLYRSWIEKKPEFLHVAGSSSVKNTEAILTAWQSIANPPPLTLVTTVPPFIRMAQSLSNVTVCSKIDDETLIELMNRCQFHLCPSQCEGFGHYLHEALGVGAVVLTSDAPPMNEFHTPEQLLIPAMPGPSLRLSTMYKVTPNEVRGKVMQALLMSPFELQQFSQSAREHFELESKNFRTNLERILGSS